MADGGSSFFSSGTPSAPAAPTSFFQTRWGPLPVWAWGLLGIGAAIAYRAWQANKDAQATTGQTVTAPADTTPGPVYQEYLTVNTPVTVPPGQGRQEPPGGPASGTDSGAAAPPRPPAPAPPTAPAPAGRYITVAKWTASNTAWNSTISGIASHFGVKSWQSIWNDPHNAALKSRRKDPKLIQPGDKVWVPA